MQSDKTNLTL